MRYTRCARHKLQVVSQVCRHQIHTKLCRLSHESRTKSKSNALKKMPDPANSHCTRLGMVNKASNLPKKNRYTAHQVSQHHHSLIVVLTNVLCHDDNAKTQQTHQTKQTQKTQVGNHSCIEHPTCDYCCKKKTL